MESIASGVASECLGLTRADYLEEIFRRNLLPCVTRQEAELLPCITRYEQEIERLKAQVQNFQENNSALVSRAALTFVQDVVDFETIRDSVQRRPSVRILFELKLGQQANGYKTRQC